MTGPIIFSHEIPRRQLVEEGTVITFRTSTRTTGETWWRKSRTGEKQGDVRVEEVEGPVTPTMDVLTDYADESGFESAVEWREAIVDLNGELPHHGWLYRATVPHPEA